MITTISQKFGSDVHLSLTRITAIEVLDLKDQEFSNVTIYAGGNPIYLTVPDDQVAGLIEEFTEAVAWLDRNED